MSTVATPPKQKRSAETAKRIVLAAEALFREQRTTSLPVADILEHAGVSRSSFYARFPDLDAVVHAVYERFLTRALSVPRQLGQDWASLRPGGDDFETYLRKLVEEHRRFYHQETGLVQAMRFRESTDPKIRRMREWLDVELMKHSIEITCRHYPGLDRRKLERILEAQSPVLVAAFRSFLDFPDQLAAAAPSARHDLGAALSSILHNLSSRAKSVA